jgi:hypothetical protein
LARFFKLDWLIKTKKNLDMRYSAAINEYIGHDHARNFLTGKANIRPAGRTWFLPHHPVINSEKQEMCRPVFDASPFYKGASLNSGLLKVPGLLTNLIGVLLRFRQHLVALSADIVKMFHRVGESGGGGVV